MNDGEPAGIRPGARGQRIPAGRSGPANGPGSVDGPDTYAEALGAVFSHLAGTVLEIGPGTSPHLPSDPADRWIGVEPNAAAAAELRTIAASRGHTNAVIHGFAEKLPLPDKSIDCAVSSLVLCSVHDPAQALSELLRVLRPEGRLIFSEHVAAPRGSWLRSAQKLLAPAEKLFSGGCDIARDTGSALEAAGFSRITAGSFHQPGPFGVRIPFLVGTAYR